MPRFYAAIDTSGIAVKSLRPDTTGTTPSSPNEGQLWADSTNHQLKYWNGTAWQQLDNVVGGTASNVQDGDKGDITVASGVWTLDTGVVTSGKILDGTIALGDLAFTPILSGGTATGDLTGTYPAPTIALLAVTAAKIANATITDVQVAAANKDGIATTPSLRTLGTGSTQAAAGNDTRFTDSRTPTGAVGGTDIGGTYPNALTINALAVTAAKIANSTITDVQVAAANKDGVVGTASMRTIGTGAQQAMAGSTRLDTIAAPTAPVSLNTQRITNVVDPTGAQDAATKNYVDSTVQGLDIHPSVRLATTTNLGFTYTATAGTSARGQFTTTSNANIDGVVLAAGNRVLVKDQTTPAQNGIYVITTLGTGANGVWDRATDFDADPEVTAGSFTFVEEGTANADSGWVVTTNNPIVIGGASGTSLAWAQFSGAGQVVDGAGLLKTGNTLDVRVDNSSIEIVGDILDVKALGVTNAMLAGGISLTSKVTGTLPLANGGTNGTDAATARASLVAPGVNQQVLGALSAGVYATVTHNLNISGTPVVSILEVSSGEEIVLDWKKTGANTIQVKSDLAWTASALNIAVVG